MRARLARLDFSPTACVKVSKERLQPEDRKRVVHNDGTHMWTNITVLVCIKTLRIN